MTPIDISYSEGNLTDYIYTDYDTYCEPTVQQTSKFLMALHIFIFLLGVAGNGLMITVLLRRRHLLRNPEDLPTSPCRG
ncbi:C-X-C chemokine receptor type 4-B-like [Dicentrarchus labrax]|uniref:C-X-C chemokine receptor type 4-B-like n=1 Tax=Dicentrarchus labrax TaxID=13489 RepID=UPI0021F67219|nr:C-X-C chemokine receptor type 4-B-like [Dicentrarchus labrax]